MSLFLSTNPPVLRNNITEADFYKHFPNDFAVRSLDAFEALKKNLSADRTHWEYQKPFTFKSDIWGDITVPKGFITDFASVPPVLRSLYDDDSPILLYPSAPHDLLFTRRADGTRGWLTPTKQLTLRQVNEVLREAMRYCGADQIARTQVFAAVELGNEFHRHEFAKKPANP